MFNEDTVKFIVNGKEIELTEKEAKALASKIDSTIDNWGMETFVIIGWDEVEMQ